VGTILVTRGRGVAVAVGVAVDVSVDVMTSGSDDESVADACVCTSVGFLVGNKGVFEGCRMKLGVLLAAGSANQVSAPAHSQPPNSKKMAIAATTAVIIPHKTIPFRMGD
jgi:hypothetical protein